MTLTYMVKVAHLKLVTESVCACDSLIIVFEIHSCKLINHPIGNIIPP